MSGLIPCSVQVLTHNSEASIRACLESLREFEEVIVLDGGSTDRTRPIALTFPNVRIVDQPREHLDHEGRILDFAAVRNRGLDHAHLTWFMFIDSDETITPELQGSIRSAVSNGSADAYTVFRRFTIDGKNIGHAAAYPALHTRLARRSAIMHFGKPVHERFDLVPGSRIAHLEGDLLIPLQDPADLWPKYRRYIALESARIETLGLLDWFKWVFFWNIRSFLSYGWRLLMLILSGKKDRLPMAYERQFLLYPLLLISETTPLLKRLPRSVRQFLLYLVTGGTATLINIGLYAALYYAGMWYVAASVVSDMFGFLSAFLLHKYVAFRRREKFMSQFLKYCFLGLWNIVASTALIYVFVELAHFDPLFGKLLVIAIMVSWNFIIYKFIVYV